MRDSILIMSGKIENSYLKGRDKYKLNDTENNYMIKNSKEVLEFLKVFDGIDCEYDEIRGIIIFNRG